MSLVPKISRLRKLPELLKYKEETKEREKKERKENQEQPEKPFEIDDEVTINPDTLSEYKVEKVKSGLRQPKSGNKKVGKNIDLKV
ncbi:hypothetical protein [Gracilimonas mengyeensis]|uniref:Uncharacterized protein n=1 Tax=Gracilimonas mengyeensis TaxID=1302730 RepID=A0A521FH69_9BACT|nr:hypothetical protein [Gracilimonas mengyeensis]SMO95485.1 hypothetical protein SAMN06265219_11935 [Gracilimonas mengyeensis]